MFADDLTGGGSDASPDSVLSEYLAETVLTGLSDEFGRERPFNGNLRPPTNIIAKGSEQGLTRVRYWTDAPAIQFRGDRIPPEFPQFRNSAPKTSSVSCMYRMSFARSPGPTQQLATFATTVNRGGVIGRASGQLLSRESCLAAASGISIRRVRRAPSGNPIGGVRRSKNLHARSCCPTEGRMKR